MNNLLIKIQRAYTNDVQSILNGITSIISILSALWMIITIQKRDKNIINQRVMFLGLGDLIFSFTNLFTPWGLAYNKNLCSFQGPFKLFGTYFSTCWCINIAYLSSKMIIERRGLNNKYSLLKHLFLALFLSIVPAILISINFLYAEYRYEDGFCSITVQTNHRDYFWVITSVANIIPFSIALGLCLFYYYRQYKYLTQESPQMLVIFGISPKRYLWYPIGFGLTYLPNAISNISIGITGKEYFILVIFHVLTSHSVGFINAITYGILKREAKRNRQLTEQSEPIFEQSFVSDSDYSPKSTKRDSIITLNDSKSLNINNSKS